MVADDHLPFVDSDLDAAARRAPFGGVVEEVRNRAGDRARDAVQLRRLQVGDEIDVWVVTVRLLDHLGDEQVEPHVLCLDRLRVPARQLDELRHECGHLGQLGDDVVQELLALAGRHAPIPREHLDVRPQARQRRSELVRRIGDELALRARGLFERGQHAVEAGRQPAELVLAPRFDPLGEVSGLRNALGGVGQAANRCQRRPRDTEPEAGGNRHAAEGDQSQKEGDASQRVVQVCLRPCDLEGDAGTDREGEHAQVGARDGRVREVGAFRAARDAERIVADGQGHGLVARAEGRAVGVHRLHVAGESDKSGAAEVEVGPVGADLAMRRVGDRLGPGAQSIVEVPAKLVAHDDEDDGRREDDGERDRPGGDDREPRPEAEMVEPAHGSRRA